MSTDNAGWENGESALAEAVRWIGGHGGDVSWIRYTDSHVGSDGVQWWYSYPEEMDFRGLAGLLELGAFGFWVSVSYTESGDSLSVNIKSEQNEMCALIAESKDESRLEAEVRLLAIRKLADTAINREKERVQMERVEKLAEQVRIFKMIR